MQETCKGTNNSKKNLLNHFDMSNILLLYLYCQGFSLNTKPTDTNGKLSTVFRASDWGHRDDVSKQGDNFGLLSAVNYLGSESKKCPSVLGQVLS